MNNNQFYNGNPNANFNYMTSNTMNQMNNQISNFKNSYTQNTPLIEKQDYRNQNNILHNNVGNSVLAENVIEYSIHMDSRDRDITLYPNQFKFSVHFNDYNMQPSIDKKFKNIKYIRLENIILPHVYYVDVSNISTNTTYTDASGNRFSDSDDYVMTNNKFLLLKIKELANDRVLSTNNIIRNDTIKLYYDVILNKFYDSWTTNQNTFVYTNGNLNNITKLTFELFDPEGNQLFFIGDILNISDATILTCPLNKYTQMTITLIFGVVQNDMNTDPNYSQ
jgi:hypothetical protein